MGGPTTGVGELRKIHQANGSLLIVGSQLTRECLVQKEIDLCTEFRCIYTFEFMNLRTPFHPSAGLEDESVCKGEKKPHAPSSRPRKVQRLASQ